MRRIGDWYRIVRPGRLSEEFFESVADTYNRAAANGRHDPCKRIADDSGYALSTVRRWVATARAKGMIEPTTPGRVSGLARRCRTCGRPL